MGQLDNYTPDDLDPTVMNATDWLQLGKILTLRHGEESPLVQEIHRFTKFGSASSISLPRVFTLNNYLRSMGRPSYGGFSDEKLNKRILPAIYQVVGFCSEVLDFEVQTFEDILMDDGAVLLSYAAALKAMKVGSSLVEEVCSET